MALWVWRDDRNGGGDWDIGGVEKGGTSWRNLQREYCLGVTSTVVHNPGGTAERKNEGVSGQGMIDDA